MLFSKNGPDSITAQVLVFVADSSGQQPQPEPLSFNTFSGAYLFYDIGLNFQYGIHVKSGAPVGSVTSIVKQGTQLVVSDRNEDPSLDCIDQLVSVFMPCVAFTECYDVIIITLED